MASRPTVATQVNAHCGMLYSKEWFGCGPGRTWRQTKVVSPAWRICRSCSSPCSADLQCTQRAGFSGAQPKWTREAIENCDAAAQYSGALGNSQAAAGLHVGVAPQHQVPGDDPVGVGSECAALLIRACNAEQNGLPELSAELNSLVEPRDYTLLTMPAHKPLDAPAPSSAGSAGSDAVLGSAAPWATTDGRCSRCRCTCCKRRPRPNAELHAGGAASAGRKGCRGARGAKSAGPQERPEQLTACIGLAAEGKQVQIDWCPKR